eukprot:CAMPEP_0185592584 /NCGR_PEP_ID=MMETSP0434-20130131/68418_1 /TAXON_ID=626734 ORGANISM="Favella taraikaensis, Strain Fe Narragansett Bay" /NCGR_SAMPLE_ID=MMETSP0434 /ASSEMBLY_ACC=CAM_ASM_000379 /LENGTH=58 /DNA_ID=CAMNT_0028218497 /DNA_START=160 /DNA_END=336 /DNA_ORIENTATION=+
MPKLSMDSAIEEMEAQSTEASAPPEPQRDLLGFDCMMYTSVEKVSQEEFLIKHKDDEG